MKVWLFILFFSFVQVLPAQDINMLTHEADLMEKQFKEEQALAKYKQAATINPTSIPILVKCEFWTCI